MGGGSGGAGSHVADGGILRSGHRSQRLLERPNRETVGSGRALECHAASASDQIEPVWPSRVRSLRPVPDAIQNRRDANAQLTNARLGRLAPLAIGARRGQQHAVLLIGPILPKVYRMGLLDVHDVEGGAVAIRIVEPVQGGNLPPEAWSSVAAEGQDHVPLPEHAGERP